MDLTIEVDDTTPGEEYDVGKRTIEVVNLRKLETKQKFMGRTITGTTKGIKWTTGASYAKNH